MNLYNDGGTGASSARNKLASYLRAHGINVYGNPPEDRDFWHAIQEWAAREIRKGEDRVRREERKNAQDRIDAMRPPIDPRPLTWKERFTGQVSKS